jgi:hypothetical protein
MKKHRLLIFERMSRQIRGKLFWLMLVLLALALYDLLGPAPILGDYWYLIWAAVVIVALFWLYYRFLMGRAYVQARPKFLRLQGPLYGVNLSYNRIYSITSSYIGQHYALDTLKGFERGIVEPIYNQACVFIELKSYPPAFRWRRFLFPRLIFGTNRPGLLCAVEDWVALSRDAEDMRGKWREAHHDRTHRRSRSLAAQVLELDDES